jgi:hypothetical protein
VIREWPVYNGKMPYGRNGYSFDVPKNNIRKFCDENDGWGETPAEAIRKWLKNHEAKLIGLQEEITEAKRLLKREENQ